MCVTMCGAFWQHNSFFGNHMESQEACTCSHVVVDKDHLKAELRNLCVNQLSKMQVIRNLLCGLYNAVILIMRCTTLFEKHSHVCFNILPVHVQLIFWWRTSWGGVNIPLGKSYNTSFGELTWWFLKCSGSYKQVYLLIWGNEIQYVLMFSLFMFK